MTAASMDTENPADTPFPVDVWYLLADALRPLATTLTAASMDPSLGGCFTDDDGTIVRQGVCAMEELFNHTLDFGPKLDDVLGDTHYLPPWLVDDVRAARGTLTHVGWFVFALGPATLEGPSTPKAESLPESAAKGMARAGRIALEAYAHVCAKEDAYYAADWTAKDQEWIDTVEEEAEEHGLTVESLARGRQSTHLLERLGDKGKTPRWDEELTP